MTGGIVAAGTTAARLAGLAAAAAAALKETAIVAIFFAVAVESVFFFVFRAGAGAFLARVVAGGYEEGPCRRKGKSRWLCVCVRERERACRSEQKRARGGED